MDQQQLKSNGGIMREIIEDIKSISLEISNLIINGELGYSEDINTTGDQQLKLDIASDVIIEKHLSSKPYVKALISEEKEEVLKCSDNAEYTICYDPLDGSSIVDANLAVGTIYGIYTGSNPRGETLVASAYVVYGPRIELVYTSREDNRVQRFRYQNDSFVALPDLQLAPVGKLNASGGTQKNWSDRHRDFVRSLFDQGYRLRYSGGMVPDLHQILVKTGGIFSYPATSDSKRGKLRVLFEVLPFALIYENAGGEAVDHEMNRLLDISPNTPHETTPCFFGSTQEIAQLKIAYGESNE